MLDFSVSQNPFRFGLAEGIEPHQVTPGTLLTAENVVWLKSGKVQKRFGTSLLSNNIVGGGTIAAGARVFARGSELCVIDGTNLYAYSPASLSWKTVGKVPNVGITSTTRVDSVGGVAAFDTAIAANGLRVDAWLTGTGSTANAALVLQVADTTSGSLVVLPSIVVAGASNCSGVRVVIIGTTAIVLTQAVASTTIKAITVDLTTLALATTNLRTDTNGSGGFDVCVIGSTFVLAYTNNVTAFKLYSYNTSLVQQATGGITSEAAGAAFVSIDGASGEVLYVLYRKAGTTAVKIAIANSSTLVETVAPVTIEAPGAINATQVAVCRYDSTHCIAAYTIPDVAGNIRVTTYQVTSAGVVTTATERGTYGMRMISRPFMFGGSCYLLLSEQSGGSATNPTDRYSVLVEVEISTRATSYTPHRYLGTIDVLIGGAWNADTPASAAVMSATSVVLGAPFQSATNANRTLIRQGVRLVNLTLGASLPVDMWRPYSPSQDAFISAGGLVAYDGRSAFDYGFTRGPVFISLTPAGGGSIAAGVYNYGAVLEYRSATGLLYRSATQTVGSTVTSGAAGQVTITVDGLNLGNKQTIATTFGTSTPLPTLVAWYRTTVGAAIYYRLTVEPSFNTTFADQSAAVASFVDSRADSDITGVGPALATRPTLYTTGGVLDDFGPPASVTLCSHAGRLWLLANDQKTWWYSKSFQDDLGTAPGFSTQFLISFPDVQTAMASMDDKAVFFSATGIKYMLGTGPAPNGLNSDFQTPTTIQSDVGCTSARSVVATPDGVMFLSDRGLYLLDRGLTLSWIGRPVKDTLAVYPVVTSAVLVAKQNQVRFTCTDAAATVGITIVYDYVEKQWSTFKHWVNGIYGGPIADACMWNGAWTFVIAAGLVYTESTTDYRDATSYYVPMTMETAWITAPSSQASPSAGPLKFQSVRTMSLHGFSNTDHDLTIQCGFDTDPSYPQSVTFLAGTPTTAIGTLEDCEISIGTRRKCNAIRFKITDASPTGQPVGTGQGPSFDMMALEVGVKRGTGNTPATKKG